MRKLILLFFASAITFFGYSQVEPSNEDPFYDGDFSPRFYIGIKSGYAVPWNREILGVKSNTETISNIYGTFGLGVPLNAHLGVMFSQNIGFDLGVGGFFGTRKLTSDTIDRATGIRTSRTVVNSNQFRIFPALLLSTNQTGKWFIFSRVGTVIPLAGNQRIRYRFTEMGVDSEVFSTLKGRISAGMIGAIAVQRNLNKNFGIYGEIEGIFLSLKADKEIFEQVTNLGAASIAVQDISYRDKVPVNNNTTSSEQLAFRSPFHSIGWNIGIRYLFGE